VKMGFFLFLTMLGLNTKRVWRRLTLGVFQSKGSQIVVRLKQKKLNVLIPSHVPCLNSGLLHGHDAFIYFWGGVLLCSPGWHGTHCVAQAGLEHTILLPQDFPVLGLQVCATMPCVMMLLNKFTKCSSKDLLSSISPCTETPRNKIEAIVYVSKEGRRSYWMWPWPWSITWPLSGPDYTSCLVSSSSLKPYSCGKEQWGVSCVLGWVEPLVHVQDMHLTLTPNPTGIL
jgi:hypothetical protein